MIYHAYQANLDLLEPFRQAASVGLSWIQDHWRKLNPAQQGNILEALLDLIANAGTTHERPDFGINAVKVGNHLVPVQEEIVAEGPFSSLLHFAKGVLIAQPRVLIVAPMSGHFATLLRHTVQVLLADHDVYITDWRNARDVPLAAGRFGFDEFVDCVTDFLNRLGPGAHLIAVCQPAVAALTAVALMAEHGNANQPLSMTLMAGPIDTRINPTRVNNLAKQRPIEWFERHLIGTVPWRHPGAFRRVYPGFMQLAAFTSMNAERHVGAHLQQFHNLVRGDRESAAAHRRFYNEYRAVMDLPAEFYLETVERVFQNHDLPLGRMEWRGRRVNLSAIRRSALFTVEGEMDDICSIGQTLAAQDLCRRLSPLLKRHHLQTGVGHYGVFNGRRWATEIYPLVREFIQTHALRSFPGASRITPPHLSPRPGPIL